MGSGLFTHLRVVTLLTAFGIGFVGQIVAVVIMPIPTRMAWHHGAVVSSACADSGDCAGCPRPKEEPTSAKMGPICTDTFCSIPLALLPLGPIVAPLSRSTFELIASYRERGLTIRPNLGPPRPLHQV